ncbi:MAG TPA: hypothetical protein VGG38_14315 [Acidimicrobiales bacterium]|jgi:hypothetical protein
MTTTEKTVQLHPDFVGLTVNPGHADIVRNPELFDVTNILALGGAVDMHPHVPTKVGQVGTAVFWESTGAADALPFWNTNLRCDVLLFCLVGEVRIEFKEMEGTGVFGSYTGRTGDMMLLPKDIAHRTFSGNGKRRISLEIIERDARWDELDWVGTVEAAPSLDLDGLSIAPGASDTEIRLNGATSIVDSSFLMRGARALVAYGLHLGHNEFEGGFIVADGDDESATLKVGSEQIVTDRRQTVALLKGLISQIEGLSKAS